MEDKKDYVKRVPQWIFNIYTEWKNLFPKYEFFIYMVEDYEGAGVDWSITTSWDFNWSLEHGKFDDILSKEKLNNFFMLPFIYQTNDKDFKEGMKYTYKTFEETGFKAQKREKFFIIKWTGKNTDEMKFFLHNNNAGEFKAIDNGTYFFRNCGYSFPIPINKYLVVDINGRVVIILTEEEFNDRYIGEEHLHG